MADHRNEVNEYANDVPFFCQRVFGLSLRALFSLFPQRAPIVIMFRIAAKPKSVVCIEKLFRRRLPGGKHSVRFTRKNPNRQYRSKSHCRQILTLRFRGNSHEPQVSCIPRRLPRPGRSIPEDYSLRPVHENAILQVITDSVRKNSPLDVASLSNEIIGRMRVGNLLDVLSDNRPLVEVRRHVVCRGADQLHTAVVRLVVRLSLIHL